MTTTAQATRAVHPWRTLYPGLIRVIEANIDNPALPGMVKTMMNVTMMPGETVASLIAKLDAVAPPVAAQPQPYIQQAVVGGGLVVARERTYSVNVELRETLSGNVNFSRRDEFSGSVDVPESIVRRGEDFIRDWLYRRFHDLKEGLEETTGDNRYGETNYDDDSDTLVVSMNCEDAITECEDNDNEDEEDGADET